MKINRIFLIGLLSLVAAEDRFKSQFKSKREFSTNRIFKPGEYTIEEIDNRDEGNQYQIEYQYITDFPIWIILTYEIPGYQGPLNNKILSGLSSVNVSNPHLDKTKIEDFTTDTILYLIVYNRNTTQLQIQGTCTIYKYRLSDYVGAIFLIILVITVIVLFFIAIVCIYNDRRQTRKAADKQQRDLNAQMTAMTAVYQSNPTPGMILSLLNSPTGQIPVTGINGS